MCERCERSRLYSGRLQLAHIEKETTKEYRERSGGWLKMKRENSCRKKMEDSGEDMELKYELWKESIFQEKLYMNVGSVCRDIGGRFFVS